MDVLSSSLNVRFWSRRETILRPVLWSPEDLRLFGCRFGDIHRSKLQGHVATPVEDSSAATGPDALREREALRLQSCRTSPFVKEGCMVNILCDDNVYAWYRYARPDTPGGTLRIIAKRGHGTQSTAALTYMEA